MDRQARFPLLPRWFEDEDDDDDEDERGTEWELWDSQCGESTHRRDVLLSP